MILSIETATKICSIAIHHEAKLLASAELHVEKSHSGALIVLIKELLNHIDVQTNQLEAIAVSEGPGSYTGLRIGISTAKGLCFAHDIPLIAINTIEAMAHQLIPFYKKDPLIYFCPMLDARRMEVYTAVYNSLGKNILATSPVILDQSTLKAEIEQANQFIVFGDGANKSLPLLDKYEHLCFVDQITPTAVSVGKLAYDKFQNQSFENLAYFEPFYLKEFYSPLPKKKLI